VSTVKVEVHSSNSSSGAGSDENLSSSSSDRGSDPGTAAGENDYEDIYEVRHRAEGVGLLHHAQHHHRGKESKSPSRDSGSHSRSGSMSSTGSGVGGTAGVVGSSVVVLHTSSGGGNGVGDGKSVNSSCSAVTNVTVNGGSTTDMIECYEPVGAMTPGTYLTINHDNIVRYCCLAYFIIIIVTAKPFLRMMRVRCTTHDQSLRM
jgi:hypothetical protein